jgi:hypothetical protein
MYTQEQHSLLDYIHPNGYSIVWYFNLYFDRFKDHASHEVNVISFLRPNDYILLPDKEAVKRSWNWAKDIFGYSDNQVRWYKRFESASDRNNRHEENLKQFKGQDVIIVCFFAEGRIRQVCDKLGLRLYGDDITILPDKRWLHDTIPGSKFKSNVFGVVDFPKGVKVPKGYTCYNEEELRKAKELLVEQDVKEFVIKPANGIAGIGVSVIKDDKDFNEYIGSLNNPKHNYFNTEFPQAYLIEERINLQAEGKFHYTPVAYFFGRNLASISKQVVQGNMFVGNSSNLFTDEINNKIIEQSKLLCEAVSTFNTGPWGVDYLIDNEGEIYCTDPNVGRFGGGIYRDIFVSLYAKGQCYFSLSCCDSDWESLWDNMVKKGISFNFKKRKGIMIFIPSDIENFARVCIVGDSEKEVSYFRDAYSDLCENCKSKVIL